MRGFFINTADYLLKEIFNFFWNSDNLENDLFGYAMKYNNPENTSLSTGRFNGNIADIDWRTSTVANDNKRRYSFTYTALTGLGRASTQSRDHQWSIKIIIMNSSPMT